MPTNNAIPVITINISKSPCWLNLVFRFCCCLIYSDIAGPRMCIWSHCKRTYACSKFFVLYVHCSFCTSADYSLQLTLNQGKNMKTRNLAIGSLALMTVFLAYQASAQSVTNDMTCQQAISTYERNGRVYVRQRSGAVLPIYVGVPLSQRNRLLCEFDQYIIAYSVPTKDKRRCAISYKCQN